jgi:hypothetical protein
LAVCKVSLIGQLFFEGSDASCLFQDAAPEFSECLVEFIDFPVPPADFDNGIGKFTFRLVEFSSNLKALFGNFEDHTVVDFLELTCIISLFLEDGTFPLQS